MKPSLKQHKVNITIWLYLNGIPLDVLTSPECWDIHEKHYNNYAFLIRITSNNNVAHDYQQFFIACEGKLMCGIQQHLGEAFLRVMYDIVTLNGGENYLEASVSFMVDFDLYRLFVAFIPNNVSHSR